MIRKLALCVFAAGFIVGAYATDSRVEVMGRQSHPWFYRDEVTIFVNPADMGLYPNMLYGSFGYYDVAKGASTSGTTSYLDNSTTDPFFGAVINVPMGVDGDAGLLIGAFANRVDPMLDRVMRLSMNSDNRRKFDTLSTPNPHILDPVGKLDLMLGYNTGVGLNLGLGYYGAFNTERNDNYPDSSQVRRKTDFHKITAGMNWEIDESISLEAAVNFGFVSVFSMNPRDATGPGASRTITPDTISENDMFIRGDLRLFSALPGINGALVPQASFQYSNIADIDRIELNAGVGVNMNIDRGFFFAGLQAIYRSFDNTTSPDEGEDLGARISFGIERNIVWDWFVIRVGGQKEVVHQTRGRGGNETNWYDNDDEDLVALGFGVNIDNRMRVDVTVSENLPYTFTNLMSGNMSHLFTRVSATFRF